MKTIKENWVFNIDILIIVLSDLLFISQLKTDVTNIIIIVIAFSIAGLLLIYSRFYYFSYNDSELIVSYLWFVSTKRFLLTDVSSIELKKAPNYGRTIVIKEQSGKKIKFGANTINKELLDDMIAYLNQKIIGMTPQSGVHLAKH